MTKNFDSLLKRCLNEMQTATAQDPLLQDVATNINHPDLRKALEDVLKKIKSNPPPKPPQQQPNQAQQPPVQQKPVPGQPNTAQQQPK